MEPVSLTDLVARIRSATPHTDEDRAICVAILRLSEDLSPSTLLAVLAEVAGRSFWFDDLVATLATFHLEALIHAWLPGLEIVDDLDVRGWAPRKFVDDWQGDLIIRPMHDLSGLVVTVGSPRGVRALRDMPRPARAPITSLSTVAREGEDEQAIERLLAELHFDGVTSVSTDRADAAVGMILRCPSIENYSGPLVADVAEALVTTAVRSVYVCSTDDLSLRILARAGWLSELYLPARADGYRTQVASLIDYPALKALHVGRGKLDDAAVAVVSQIAGLERLFIEQNPFGDEGGVLLARLVHLRALDLHQTSIGDVTVAALADLPMLEELDLAETRIGVGGLVALGRARSLRRLGLAWNAPDEMTAAVNQADVGIAWNDYISGGGALWSGGYMGP